MAHLYVFRFTKYGEIDEAVGVYRSGTLEHGMVTYIDRFPLAYREALTLAMTRECFRDYWARNVNPNTKVKVYIGAYGASVANTTGYVSISTLKSIAVQMRRSYPSFGGVALWDASLAYGKRDSAIYGITHDIEVMGARVMGRGGRWSHGRIHF